MQFINPISFGRNRDQEGDAITRMSLPEIIGRKNNTYSSLSDAIDADLFNKNNDKLHKQIKLLSAKINHLENGILVQPQPQAKFDNHNDAVEVSPNVIQTTDDSIDATTLQANGSGISIDSKTQVSPFIPSWRVYWGQKEYQDEESEELKRKQEEAKKAVEEAEQEKKEVDETAEKELEEAKQAAEDACKEAKQAAEDEYNQTVEQVTTERDNTIQTLENTLSQAQQAYFSAQEAYTKALSDGSSEEAVEAARELHETASSAFSTAQQEYNSGKLAANEAYNSAIEDAKATKEEAEQNAEDEKEDAIIDAELEEEKTKSDAQAKLDEAKGRLEDVNNGKEWGLKIWNPKVVLDGKEIEVENGDILLDANKDKESQGTWYIGLFQEATTVVVRVIHSSDSLMSSARMLIPLCQVKEDGDVVTQYHIGVVIIGGTFGCFDISGDKKTYLNPYYRVEQYIFQLADATIPIKKGLHVVKIENATGSATIEVLDDISNLSDDSVDYSYSYIPLYLVEIGKDDNDKDCITSMIDFRNIPTAQALLAVAQ